MNHRYADASNKAENYERAAAFLSSWIEDSLVVPPIKAAAKAAKHPQRHLPFSLPLSDLPPSSDTLRRRTTISNEDNINSLVNCLQVSIMSQHEHQDLQNPSLNHGVSPTCVDAVLHKKLPSRRVGGVIPALPFCARSRSQHLSTSSSRNPCGRDQLPSLRSASATPSQRARHSHTDPCSPLRRNESSGDHQRHRSCGDTPSESQSEEVVRSADVHPSMKNTDEKTSPLPSNRPSQTKSSHKSKKSRRHTVATENNPSTIAAVKPSPSEASLSLDRLRELDGPNFDLGDTFRSTKKYQIIESNPTKALHLVNQLRIHDFAWVLRSSHEWTYAIVAEFPNDDNEASIRFVIDKLGNTKTLKMKHWAKCIRLVDAKSTSH